MIAGQLAGMARFNLPSLAGDAAAALWYIAVRSDVTVAGNRQPVLPGRGRACPPSGGRPSAEAVVFEVETPTGLAIRPVRATPSRRIAFYRRSGARLLTGIRYTFNPSAGSPPIEMSVMLHPLRRSGAWPAPFELSKGRALGATVERIERASTGFEGQDRPSTTILDCT